MPVLELRHLKKYYATQKAVDDISFSIEEGSIFGLLGPNGAGKTTLLRMITGIFYPDEGEVLFNANVIKDEIFNLAKQGATIIFSTHRMEQVEEICDHIVLVNRGQKILDGTVYGIKQRFKQNLFRIGFDAPPTVVATNTFQIVAE